MDAEKSWRVKVYRLNDEGQWDDRGTGLAAVLGSFVVVVDEQKTTSRLLEARVKSSSGGLFRQVDSPYQRQGENIITLDADASDGGSALETPASAEREPEREHQRAAEESPTTVALSFQEAAGCEEVWRRLGEAQTAVRVSTALFADDDDLDDDGSLLRERRLSLSSQNDERFLSSATDEPCCDDIRGTHSSRIFLAHALGARGADLEQQLACEAEPTSWQALPAIRSYDAAHEWVCWLARAAPIAPARERYALALAADGASLLRQFGSFFADAEELDDVAVLRKLADVAKLVVLLNEPRLIEAILTDSVYENFLGSLEYAADFKKKETTRASSPPPVGPKTPSNMATPCSSLKSLDSTQACAGDDQSPLDETETPKRRPETPVQQEDPRTAEEARRVPLRRLHASGRRKEVVPFDDELKARVERHVRARVLRDAVLRPGLDEAQLSALHTVIFWTTNDVLRRLHAFPPEECSYLQRVIDATRGDRRTDAVAFLKEMTSLARGASAVVRDALYRAAVRDGVFDALADVLADSDTFLVRATCADVLLAFVRVDAPALRRDATAVKSRGRRHPPQAPWLQTMKRDSDKAASSKKQDKAASSKKTDLPLSERTRRRRPETAPPPNETLSEESDEEEEEDDWSSAKTELVKDDNRTLSYDSRQSLNSQQQQRRRQATPEEEDTGNLSALYWLCRLANDANDAVASTAATAMKLVLEIESMDDAERDPFLTCAYEYYVPWFAAPLFAAAAERRWAARSLICETLAYCVRAHAYPLKYFLLRSHLVVRVASLASCDTSSRAFRLAAVRFVRSCVGVKDDFYARYLVKNNTLGAVLSLIATVKEDSLVACAVAELLEFLRSENLKPLVEHVVRHHADKLSPSPTHAKLLESLRQRLAQNEDSTGQQLQRKNTGFLTLKNGDDHHSSEDDLARPSPARGERPGLTSAQLARRERILLEDRDEAYFEDSDDEEESSSKKHSGDLKRSSADAFDKSMGAPVRKPRRHNGDSSGEESDDSRASKRSRVSETTTKAAASDDDFDDDDGFVPRVVQSNADPPERPPDAERPTFLAAKPRHAQKKVRPHRPRHNRRVEIKWSSSLVDARVDDDLAQQKRPRLVDDLIATSS